MTIRLVVVAETPLDCEMLTLALETNGIGRLELLGAFVDVSAAIDVAKTFEANVVILDLNLRSGIDVIGALSSLVPAAQVVVLAIDERAEHLAAWAEAGVAGFVTRSETIDDLVATVASVVEGETRCSPRVAKMLFDQVHALASNARPAHPQACLTAREREISILLEEGLANKEIALALHIELSTVKNHVHNILEKLGARRRAEVVAVLRCPPTDVVDRRI